MITNYEDEVRNIQWFISNDGVSYTPIINAKSQTYTVPTTTPAGTYYYKAEYESGNCGWFCRWTDEEQSFTVTINTTPAAPTTTDNARCGNGSVTLTASGGTNGNYRWYTTATGGTPISGATNATYTTPIISSNTTYYVSIRNASGCESSRTPVTAYRHPGTISAMPSATGSRCGTGQVILTATGAPAGATYRWYTNASGGTPIATGTTYTTPSLGDNTIYYVSIVSISGCGETSRTAVTATVNMLPASPAATGASRSGIGSVTLTASGGTSGNYRWYTTATGGTPITNTSGATITGNTYSPTITATTTYYVATRNATTGCESPRTPVTATLNQVPGNAAPAATDVINTTLISNTDGRKTIDKLNATDANGSIYLYTLATIPAPAQGVLLVNSQPASIGQSIYLSDQLSFDPEVSFFGTAKFTYTATDNQGAFSTNTATYYIPINAAPVASDVTTPITVNGEQNIRPLSALDLDGLDDIANFTIRSLPADGTFTIGPGGAAVVANSPISPSQAKNLYYTPSGWGWFLSQTYTFTYTVTDAKGVISNVATYTLPINGTFGAPSITPTAENISNNPLLNTAPITDIKPLSATGGTINWYYITSLPEASSGTLYYGNTPVILTNGEYAVPTNGAGNLKFDPNPAYRGNATFTYKASNTENNFSADAIYTIPVHTLSRVVDITTALVLKSAGYTAISDLTAPDPSIIDKYQIRSLPTSGTLFINGTPVTSSNLTKLYLAKDGSYNGLTYTPNPGFGGEKATFNFVAYNKDGYASNIGTYTIPVTHAPIAQSITNSATLSTAAPFTAVNSLVATDQDGMISTFRLTQLPSSGSVYVNKTLVTSTTTSFDWSLRDKLTFDPVAGSLDDVVFSYLVTDNSGAISKEVTFTIPINGEPIAQNTKHSTAISSSAPATALDALKGKDAETSGTNITHFQIKSLPTPAQGKLFINGVAAVINQDYPWSDRINLTFDPEVSNASNVKFRFTVKDNEGAYDATPATYTIPIIQDNDFDGVADNIDLDNDNDGITDAIEGDGDQDGDGIPNKLDLDSDGDGVWDAVEANVGRSPAGLDLTVGWYTSAVGTNGLINALETTSDSGILEKALPDSDNDTVPDYLDADSDNDGILDRIEAVASKVNSGESIRDLSTFALNASYTSMATTYSEPIDTDGDGTPDYLDFDSDNDGMSDTEEAYDIDNDGQSLQDLLKLAEQFGIRSGSRTIYPVPNSDNVTPDWLKESSRLIQRLRFQTFGNEHYLDSDGDGLVDLFDTDSFGTDESSNLNSAFRRDNVVTPLPITLVSFSATANKLGVELNWKTASEINNDKFIIERSSDGKTYTTIGEVKGNGNSNVAINYSFTDLSLPYGTNYYRLKQIDFGGKYEYSKVVAVTVENLAVVEAKAFPNPFRQNTTLTFTALKQEKASVIVYDARGSVVKQQTLELQQGVNNVSISLPTPHKTAGLYIIAVRAETFQASIKVLQENH
ncbi:Ig-like domain-containing protein [Pontibacter sp. H249]|uniref:Ig-like domain-containing protein n=1 Tax=Pontibacter sp. H249 TaxID=3133420 RepID=UPI0030C236F2